MLLALLAAPAQAEVALATRADVIRWTYAYSDLYGADAADLLRIGYCESGLQPYPRAGDFGLSVGPYQFHARGIWGSTPQAAAGYSRYDPEANVAAAAWLYSQGYAYSTLGWYTCARVGGAVPEIVLGEAW